MKEQPSEDGIRDSMRKHQQDMEGIQQALIKHEATLLRKEVVKSKDDLITLKDDIHKKHLEQIRNDILELTCTVTDIISVTDLRELKNIQALLASLSKKLLEYNTEGNSYLKILDPKASLNNDNANSMKLQAGAFAC